eukprot:TRINITY_DN1573_c5_g2_i1.p1 TRINITY_DN1573_c5_g2~~TRINITY_DN1573_c5_g2_i1.p1  ORF type:complete len:245 (+),score=19.42 TRINITY_DN1573_c5_g2_i1:183-917(+)
MAMNNVILAAVLITSTVLGSRILLQTFDDYSSMDTYVVAYASSSASGDSVSTSSSTIASTIVSNPWDTSGIAGGIQQVVSSGDSSQVSTLANALVQADSQGQSRALGDTFYQMLTQQGGVSYSEAESMAIVINAAIEELGCDAISGALIQMELIAVKFGQVDTISNILKQFGPTKECMEQTVEPTASAFTQVERTRMCAKNHNIVCDSGEVQRRFLHDGNNCYLAHECPGQGYSTLKECRDHCS